MRMSSSFCSNIKKSKTKQYCRAKEREKIYLMSRTLETLDITNIFVREQKEEKITTKHDSTRNGRN